MSEGDTYLDYKTKLLALADDFMPIRPGQKRQARILRIHSSHPSFSIFRNHREKRSSARYEIASYCKDRICVISLPKSLMVKLSNWKITFSCEGGKGRYGFNSYNLLTFSILSFNLAANLISNANNNLNNNNNNNNQNDLGTVSSNSQVKSSKILYSITANNRDCLSH